MNLKRLSLFIFCLLLGAGKLFAQQDAFSGTWQMIHSPGNGHAPIKLILQIAVGERSILYPAHLKVQTDGFSGEYDLLLAKKSTRELAISRNKYATSQHASVLNESVFFLNGILDFSKDPKGVPLLRLYRMQSSGTAKKVAFSTDKIASNNNTITPFSDLFKTSEIIFRKINDSAWISDDRSLMLSPTISPIYFGLQDTIHLPERAGVMIFPGNKKKTSDIFSVAINGRIAVEQQRIDKKDHTREILLDTGMNILVFFADQFVNNRNGNGKLLVEFNQTRKLLDFTSKSDSGAMFIVAKFYCGADQSKEKHFVVNATNPDPLKQYEKLAGSIIVNSKQLRFGIWDDAQEDGDSISISSNGRWLVEGFAVKKKPQFITVILEPGANKINFIANNLGSIPPNTSVLEIIDGNKRQSFFMEAGLGESNVVRIFYQVNATAASE